jgi:amino acid transporter
MDHLISFLSQTQKKVLTGIVAANNAGPAVILSFGIAAVAAAFAALCYAELASMIPVSGRSVKNIRI